MNISQTDILELIAIEWDMAHNVDHNAWYSVMNYISAYQMISVKAQASKAFMDDLQTLWSLALELYTME